MKKVIYLLVRLFLSVILVLSMTGSISPLSKEVFLLCAGLLLLFPAIDAVIEAIEKIDKLK